MDDRRSSDRRLARILSATFAIALVMGPGPGLWLINPGPDDDPLLFGVPKVYLWALLWFVVMSGCILIAAATLWRRPE